MKGYSSKDVKRIPARNNDAMIPSRLVQPNIGDALNRSIGCGIRALLLFAQWLRPPEVKLAQAEFPVLVAPLIEDERKRMCLDNVKEAPRLEEVGNNLRPAFEVWQPIEDAVRGEHRIELAGENLWQIIEVTMDKGRRKM